MKRAHVESVVETKIAAVADKVEKKLKRRLN